MAARGLHEAHPSMLERTETRQGLVPSPAGAGIGWRTRTEWASTSGLLAALMLGALTGMADRATDSILLRTAPPAIFSAAALLAFLPGAQALDRITSRALPLLALPVALSLIVRATSPVYVIAALHLTVLFLACLACSRRIARKRPAGDARGEFYFWTATGMVAGAPLGLLVAPAALQGTDLYPVLVVVACGLMERRMAYRERPLSEFALPAVAGVLTMAAVRMPLAVVSPPLVVAALAVPAMISYRAARRPATFAGALALMFIAGGAFGTDTNGAIAAGLWAFFGIFRVRLGSVALSLGNRELPAAG